MKTLLLSIVCAMLLSSCATILTGSKQTVTVVSEPSGASIYADSAYSGLTPFNGKLPRKTTYIEIRKEGYADAAIKPIRKGNGVYWLNLALFPFGFIPCPLGMLADLRSGAAYKIDDYYSIKLEKK